MVDGVCDGFADIFRWVPGVHVCFIVFPRLPSEMEENQDISWHLLPFLCFHTCLDFPGCTPSSGSLPSYLSCTARSRTASREVATVCYRLRWTQGDHHQHHHHHHCKHHHSHHHPVHPASCVQGELAWDSSLWKVERLVQVPLQVRKLKNLKNSNYQVIHIIKSTSFQIHHNPPKGVDDHCPGWFAGTSRNWCIILVKLLNAVQKNHPFAVAVLLHPVELLHDQLPPRAGDRPVLGRRQLLGSGRGARLNPQILQHVDGESALIWAFTICLLRFAIFGD